MYPWEGEVNGQRIEGALALMSTQHSHSLFHPPKRKALRGPWEEVLFL